MEFGAFLHFKKLYYFTTCQAAAGSQFPISDEKLPNV